MKTKNNQQQNDGSTTSGDLGRRTCRAYGICRRRIGRRLIKRGRCGAANARTAVGIKRRWKLAPRRFSSESRSHPGYNWPDALACVPQWPGGNFEGATVGGGRD